MRIELKDLCDIQLGMQFRGRIEPAPEGTHDVIIIRDIGPDRRLRDTQFEGSERTSVSPTSPPERYLVTPGDVLFLARGQVNYAVPITQKFVRPTIAPSFFFILRPRKYGPRLLPEYLAWVINRPEAQDYLQQKARRGSHMPLVGKDDIQKLSVPVPPVEVQEHVVMLDRLARRERELVNLIADLNQQRIRAVCERAVNRKETI